MADVRVGSSGSSWRLLVLKDAEVGRVSGRGHLTEGGGALETHGLGDGPRFSEAEELLEDEQFFFRRRRQPAVQRRPTGVLSEGQQGSVER